MYILLATWSGASGRPTAQTQWLAAKCKQLAAQLGRRLNHDIGCLCWLGKDTVWWRLPTMVP
jgi:hypothetical protein